MKSDLLKTVRLEEVEEIIRVCARIFGEMGFKNQPTPGPGRQIIFDNQIFIQNSALTLSVVVLSGAVGLDSRTFNFEFRNLPGKPSAISLQEREIKSAVVQLVEARDYKQLSISVYFAVPLTYQGEDLVFRVRVEQSPTGPRVKMGFPWMDRQTHLSGAAALELVQKISGVLVT